MCFANPLRPSSSFKVHVTMEIPPQLVYYVPMATEARILVKKMLDLYGFVWIVHMYGFIWVVYVIYVRASVCGSTFSYSRWFLHLFLLVLPGSLTLKISLSKRKVLFHPSCLRGYVTLRGCTYLFLVATMMC